MENYSPPSVSPLIIQSEKGFKTSLFGFEREQVLAFIDQLISENTMRNQQLNSSLVSMESKVYEVETENSALCEKNYQFVSLLEEKNNAINDLNIELQNKSIEAKTIAKRLIEIQKELSEEKRAKEAGGAKLYAKEQENVLLVSENVGFRKQVVELTDKLELARETSKYADETIVAAQRAATRIMTDATKKSPPENEKLPAGDFVSIKECIIKVEKQLRNVAITLEKAIDKNIAEQNFGYYNENNYVPEIEKPTDKTGGWLSANIPQQFSQQKKSVSIWQPAAQPKAPIGWQQPKVEADERMHYRHKAKAVSKSAIRPTHPKNLNYSSQKQQLRKYASGRDSSTFRW